jgi:hypothetical protein
MNQPEALRLADELLALHGPTELDERVTTELRRLHELHELYQDKTQRQQTRITTLEAALRLALEALEQSRVFVTTREKIKHPEGTEWYDEAITVVRQALKENT